MFPRTYLSYLAALCLSGCMLNRDLVSDSTAGDPISGDPVGGDVTPGDLSPGDPAGVANELTVDQSTLQAAVTQGSPVSFQVTLSEELSRAVAWTASSNQTWLVVSPASGTTPSILTLDATTTALSIGEATATVDIVSPGPGDNGTSISVSLDVIPPFAVGFDAIGGPPGGRVTGIAVDPNNSQRIHVATEEWWDGQGGALISLSTDGGATFTTTHLELNVFGGQGVILATGRGYWALADGGVYRTDDSGDTWTVTSLQNLEVWSIAASSGDPDMVLTADGTNVQKSINGGADWTPIALAGDAWAVATDPTTVGRFFAGDSLGNLYWSDGTTFTPIAVDGDACGLACAVTAAAASTGGRWVIANYSGEIAFTDDGGSNWTWGGAGLVDGVNGLMFDASGNLWATTWSSGVLSSSDGGSTFYSTPTPGIQNGGTWPLAEHPSGLLVGHEVHGLLRLESGVGLVETGLLAHGLVELDYHVASGDVFGFSTTGVVFRWNRNDGFSSIAGNLTLADTSIMDISADPADPTNILLVGIDLGIERTTDGGATWVSPLGIATDKVYSLSRAPEDPTVVWTGTDSGLYRSINNGVSFTQVVSGSTYDVAAVSATAAVYDAGSEVHRVDLPSAPVLVVDESVWLLTRTADGSIFVGDPDAGIQRSFDGGLTFVPLGLAGAGPWDIEVDPNDPDRIFATYYQVDMMMTIDAGQNWMPMSAPAITLGLAIDPVSSTLFIGSHHAGLLTWTD